MSSSGHRASPGREYRLAVVQTHPVQYHAPFYRALAEADDLDITVFYGSGRYGCETTYDEGFGLAVRWDVPVLEGYRSVFLRNVSPRPSVNRLFGLLTPETGLSFLKGRFDAVLLNGYGLAYFWLALLSAKALGLPVLLRAETTTLRRPGGEQSALRRLMKAALLRPFLSSTAGFLPIGTLSADFYRAHGVPEKRLFEAPYCVDNAFFRRQMRRCAGARDRVRADLGIRDEAVGVYVAKLIPRKRPLDLLRAYAGMKLRRKMALIFVGAGRLRPEMEQFVREHGLRRVHFVGFKNQKALSPYYMACDFSVLPSAFESWGLVVNEAMVHGLPVVTTDMVSSAYDLVRPGRTGWRYPAGDVGALSDILDAIVGDPGRCEPMGRAARELVAQYDFAACVEGVRRCLRYVLERRRRGPSSPDRIQE